jgi:hypothetical protein
MQMKFAKLAIAATLLAATPALANEQVVTGATVYGPQGHEVGKIVSVANGQAVVDTGKHKVPLGIELYGKGETGPTITVTRDQLNGMVDEQLAAAAAKRDEALTVGASALAYDNAPLGTVIEIDGDNIVIARGGDEANKVTLLREYFDATAQGLKARLTNAQIDAALAKQAS